MSLQKCDAIEHILNTSPLRRSEDITDLVGLSAEISTVMQRLAKIKSELATTLKVFLIGEVKAGKSTLINALVGAEVAPTNILEATAAIWEFGYAEQPSTTLIYKDGHEQVVNHSDIMSFSGTDGEQLEFAEKIAKITIKTNQHQFKELLLVDSPGLSTLTAQNAELTKNIMQEVDLALWVFNANHLGQTDIMEQVYALTALGKPIIAVINKIDEAEDSPEKLVRFLRRSANEYFKEIFALSAFQALPKNNQVHTEFLEYFKEFKNYLLEQVSEKSSEVKNESIGSTLNALVSTEKVLHESAVRTLNQLQQEQRDYAAELNYEKNRLSDDINIRIEQSCNDLTHDIELKGKIKYALKPEANTSIASMIKVVGASSPSALKKALSQDESSLDEISQEYLHIINDEIYGAYKSRYTDIIGVTNQKMITRMTDFQQKEKLSINSQLQLVSAATWISEEVDVVETLTTGAIVSTAGGVTLAGYSALLGANAAAVTMGAAMTAVALPIVIVGTVGAGAYAMWKKHSNQEKEAEKLEAQVKQVQLQIADAITKNLVSIYSSRIGADFDVVEKENEKLLFGGLSRSNLNKLQNEIENYAMQLPMLVFNE